MSSGYHNTSNRVGGFDETYNNRGENSRNEYESASYEQGDTTTTNRQPQSSVRSSDCASHVRDLGAKIGWCIFSGINRVQVECSDEKRRLELRVNDLEEYLVRQGEKLVSMQEAVKRLKDTASVHADLKEENDRLRLESEELKNVVIPKLQKLTVWNKKEIFKLKYGGDYEKCWFLEPEGQKEKDESLRKVKRNPLQGITITTRSINITTEEERLDSTAPPATLPSSSSAAANKRKSNDLSPPKEKTSKKKRSRARGRDEDGNSMMERGVVVVKTEQVDDEVDENSDEDTYMPFYYYDDAGRSEEGTLRLPSYGNTEESEDSDEDTNVMRSDQGPSNGDAEESDEDANIVQSDDEEQSYREAEESGEEDEMERSDGEPEEPNSGDAERSDEEQSDGDSYGYNDEDVNLRSRETTPDPAVFMWSREVRKELLKQMKDEVEISKRLIMSWQGE